ncbi:MAG: MmcQ/YjbR family DNA-binding protein [Endomicrobia bacterium]|nr:MmcQ/YjbR family DNA-binding protein [Endomicrobiia bacterium]
MAFNGIQTNKVLKYVKKKYETEPEFLWRKFPNNAILRHNKNSKWYAALLNISPKKLGIDGNENIDILNLRCDPLVINFIMDGKNFFPGYHMNKSHWVTIVLNGAIKDTKLFSLIDASYNLTADK